jgi:hypothetical protein
LQRKRSLWSSGAGLWPFGLGVICDQVIPAHCKGKVMARLENPSEWKMW